MNSVGTKTGLIKNIAMLGVLQFGNYLVPLLLLPILTRRLGIEEFGTVAVTLAAIQIACIVADYGFSVNAAHAVATNKSDLEYVRQKIGSVCAAKAIIVSIVIALTLLSVIFVSDFEKYRKLIFPACVALIAQAFIPTWVFQGLEQMKWISIYGVAGKLIYAISVYTYAEDSTTVIYFWALTQWVTLFASLWILKTLGFGMSLKNWRAIFTELKSGLPYFISRIAVTTYTAASTVIVGATVSTIEAAKFSIADQVYKAAQGGVAPVNTALFPFMARTRAWRTFFLVILVVGVILSIICAVVAIFAGEFLVFIFGSEYHGVDRILQIYLVTAVINFFAIVFGYPVFAAIGNMKPANWSVYIGSLFYVCGLAVMWNADSITGEMVAFLVLMTETLVLVIRFITFSYLRSRI